MNLFDILDFRALLDSDTFLETWDAEQLMFHCLFLADIHWECQAFKCFIYIYYAIWPAQQVPNKYVEGIIIILFYV